MIQVNLLPGAHSRSSRRGAFAVTEMVSGAASGIKDKYFLAAAGSVTTVLLAVGTLFMSQSARERSLTEREARAMQDSARLSVVLEAKAKAEAARDSLYHQVAIIKSIDDARYLWPHLLDEVSNALPQFTWLTSISQTSAPPSATITDTSATRRKAAAKKTPDAKEKKARADSVLAEATRATKFRIVGHTVDIQALTRFMKTLESSPFIQNVQLTRSDLVLTDGKEVTEFQLEAESQSAPPFLLKTVAVSLEEN